MSRGRAQKKRNSKISSILSLKSVIKDFNNVTIVDVHVSNKNIWRLPGPQESSRPIVKIGINTRGDSSIHNMSLLAISHSLHINGERTHCLTTSKNTILYILKIHHRSISNTNGSVVFRITVPTVVADEEVRRRSSKFGLSNLKICT